jgi:hypothetical protein
MAQRGSGVLVAAAAALAGACSSAGVPTLPASQAPLETGNIPAPGSPIESLSVAQGTPTEVYALVARGALGCWFGAEGPLRNSHVFQAEAAPPSQGGAAEIVIHERDVSLRDQRGPRAYRISFTAVGERVNVSALDLKMLPPLGTAMATDVAQWAKGGSGCQLRIVSPPQAAAPPAPIQPARTRAPNSAKR